MKLTLKEVDHIADLARLYLSEEEKLHYLGQLSEILEFASRLQEVDTSDIPPTSSVLPVRSILRPDEPRPGLSTSELLKNAPQYEKDQFRVPYVLE